MKKSDIGTEIWELTMGRFVFRPDIVFQHKALRDFPIAERLSTLSEREAGSKYQPWVDLRSEMDHVYLVQAVRELPKKKRNILRELSLYLTSFFAYDLESKLGKTVIGSVDVRKVAEDFSAIYMSLWQLSTAAQPSASTKRCSSPTSQAAGHAAGTASTPRASSWCSTHHDVRSRIPGLAVIQRPPLGGRSALAPRYGVRSSGAAGAVSIC